MISKIINKIKSLFRKKRTEPTKEQLIKESVNDTMQRYEKALKKLSAT